MGRAGTTPSKRKASGLAAQAAAAAGADDAQDLPPAKIEALSEELYNATRTSKRGKAAAAKVKDEDSEVAAAPATPAKAKKEEDGAAPLSAAQKLSERKLAAYKAAASSSTFPGFDYPSAKDAWQVAELLAEYHGYPKDDQGKQTLPRHQKPENNDNWGGCGNV